MKPQTDPEVSTQSDELSGDRIFAAIFKCVFFALAVCDGALEKLSRRLRTK